MNEQLMLPLFGDDTPRVLTYQGGRVYKEYLIYKDGRVLDTKRGRFATHLKNFSGSSKTNRYDVCVAVRCPYIKSQNKLLLSVALAHTYPDLIGYTPLTEHFNLKPGDKGQFKTSTGYTFKVGAVTIDHIDLNNLNNSLDNLRVATGFEQQLNSIKTHGASAYKGVTLRVRSAKKWEARFRSVCLLDHNLDRTVTSSFHRHEEKAALRYNQDVEECLVRGFGDELGIKVLVETAYLNKIPRSNEIIPNIGGHDFLNII